MASPLIEFRDVRKAFGSLKVLDGLNVTIEKGRVTTIIGRSGVGKSVLLKHIVGLLEPDGGEILYEGQDLLKLDRAERAAMKRRFSYMFQSTALFDSMTVFDNIALPLREKTRMRRREIRDRVMEKIEELELKGTIEKYPSQLSGGMRKRVALARALITGPEIILFDEPTTGLDPVRRNAVHDMISQYQSHFGFTAVVVSHDIPEVFRISQKVAMLEKGKIRFEGTADEVETSDDPVIRRFVEGLEPLENDEERRGS